MAVDIWTPGILATKAGEQASELPEGFARDWLDSVEALVNRAHARGDGVAVYVNVDLGHPDIGQWQVVSYGSEASQLETRKSKHFESTRETLRLFANGEDEIPLTLPDIGGRINWRYYLHAVVPASTEPKAANDPTTDCCGRDAANCDCAVTVIR